MLINEDGFNLLCYVDLQRNEKASLIRKKKGNSNYYSTILLTKIILQ